ncbi:MAG: methionyl-tRNA formyltransferase [Bacteroidetes bacterium]|nr:methionyl-tRNA formyltransferase [Bacteroidota bacterium]
MRILFFGTPEFAACSLQLMIERGFQVVGVVTAPDKPAGRGLKVRESAVKQVALSYGIPVLQPVNLKAPEFQEQLKVLAPDLGVVIAFRMLPQSVWSLPPMGTFNLHASLLPDYRGAAPINRALMNGEKKTGVTTFFLKHEIDTGDILLQDSLEILPDENAGNLHDRLMHLGADLVICTLEGIRSKSLNPKPQEARGTLHAAPKIFPEDCRINWDLDCALVHNHIRGLAPIPGAFTSYKGMHVKILESRVLPKMNAEPGSWYKPGPGRVAVACKRGAIEVLMLQPEGKKKMAAADFANGWMQVV